MATYGAVLGLVSFLITPWALFALLWPVSDAVGSMTLPGDVWNTIELFAASKGGRLEGTEELNHPHA